MPLIDPIIRPPAEAGSVLLQLTLGCSANRCSFCGAYRQKPFRLKEYEEISRDISEAARDFPSARRVFLLDGDALAMRNEQLLPILSQVNRAFPALGRIGSYANGYNITQRSDEQLRQLAAYKLRLLYIGLESGSQRILDQCRKVSTVEEMIAAVHRSRICGIKSSVMVLLGLGGVAGSREHVTETIRALNHMQPRYLSLLSVMVLAGTPLRDQVQRNEFQELSARQLLQETYGIIQGLELSGTIFRSNHASNFLALEGRLPQDKEKLLSAVEAALSGDIPLTPQWMRGL